MLIFFILSIKSFLSFVNKKTIIAIKLTRRGEDRLSEEWYEGAHFFRRAIFRFGDCDSQKRASLYSIMKLFSEISGDDYEGRGLGHDFLLERGKVLMLSKLSLKIIEVPLHRENVIAETWERTLCGPFVCREYEMRDENKQLIVSGTSRWFLADPITREILRPNMLPQGERLCDPRSSACPECKKIKMPEVLSTIGQRKIYYSDLDSNGHVNNAVYGKIATDFLPEEFRQRKLKDFSIDFSLETKENEILEISGAYTVNGYIIQGLSDNKRHFTCEFEY